MADKLKVMNFVVARDTFFDFISENLLLNKTFVIKLISVSL